jgi:glycerol-3-phosphate acyltransferase PlsY
MLVLALDIGKGMLAVMVARWLDLLPNVEVLKYIDLACGALAILGHNLPVFLKFKGGKGGATLIGVLAIIMPLWGIPIYLASFGLMMAITRFPTLSYGVAFLCFPFLAAFAYHRVDYLIYACVLLLVPCCVTSAHNRNAQKSHGGWKQVPCAKTSKRDSSF